MKLLLFALLTLAGFTALADPYHAKDYSPADCAARMAAGVVVTGPKIRGAMISMLRGALKSRAVGSEESYRIAGVLFDHDPSFAGSDGDFVEFKDPSFRTIINFFAELKSLDLFTEKIVHSVEATFMHEIGAVVYGDTAQDLFNIYRANAIKNNEDVPSPHVHITSNGNNHVRTEVTELAQVEFTFRKTTNPQEIAQRSVADFRQTSFAQLSHFIGVVESAPQYSSSPQLRAWVTNAQGLFVAAKNLDPAALDRAALSLGQDESVWREYSLFWH